MTRYVHCLTLSLVGLADSDLGSKTETTTEENPKPAEETASDPELKVLRGKRSFNRRRRNVWKIAHFSIKYFPLKSITITVMFVPIVEKTKNASR